MSHWTAASVGAVACSASASSPAEGAAAWAPDTGDTAWMLVSTALVLLMTLPGLALFYGGLVRGKNVLSVLMHSLFCAALVSVVWVVFGYSLAFGPVREGVLSGWLGGWDHVMLSGTLSGSHPLAGTIPHVLFAAFQMTFAIITPALISGAFAERMRFGAFALLALLWSVLVYVPLAHWVWGGGWIGTGIGALDFAGGTVVHISSGVSALVCAVVLGKRRGLGVEPMPPHNLPLTVIGASLLWVGWFGFNAGSAVGSGALASLALINTHTAAAAAALAWVGVEFMRARNATILGAASGAVAGLVAITPAAGFVGPGASLVIGVCAGAVCYAAVTLKPRLGYDDALDVVGVHFVGGTLGALLTGVFASSLYNPAVPALTGGGDGGAWLGSVEAGLIEGSPVLLLKQLAAVGVTIAYAGGATWVILKVVGLVMPARATAAEETLGLDLSQHSERAYALPGGELVAVTGLAEPRSADQPPAGEERFTVEIIGIEAERVLDRWRALCQERATAPSAAFLLAYSRVTTVREGRFRVRGGGGPGGAAERERLRAALESLFADLDKGVTARMV